MRAARIRRMCPSPGAGAPHRHSANIRAGARRPAGMWSATCGSGGSNECGGEGERNSAGPRQGPQHGGRPGGQPGAGVGPGPVARRRRRQDGPGDRRLLRHRRGNRAPPGRRRRDGAGGRPLRGAARRADGGDQRRRRAGGRLPDRPHRRIRGQRPDQTDHRGTRSARRRGEQRRQVAAPLAASPVRPAARLPAHHRRQLPGAGPVAARAVAGHARQRPRARRERVQRRGAGGAGSAVGRLPGVQGSLRPVAAQRGPRIARRRRARQHGLLRVGPDPDDRAHTGFGPAARVVAGPGGRRHRQGRHRAAAHPRAALGAAGRAGLGAAGRPGGPRRTAVASPVLHRRRGGRP